MRVLALSSGTSVDAIDVALADLSDADGVVHVHLLGHAERPWPAATTPVKSLMVSSEKRSK
jgi:anhydro-N-acetylmuramic acid kinase